MDIIMTAGNKIINVKINGPYIPQYQSEDAAGCDLCATIAQDTVIPPHGFSVIPTGIRIQMPPGYEAQVRPRSGLAFHHGIGILNAPGTVDSDYRGEIKVILFNTSEKAYTVRNGDRIAQLVISQTVRAEFEPADTLDESERGRGGFGHTGVQ
jgi:dUTP pyrophosphatase